MSYEELEEARAKRAAKVKDAASTKRVRANAVVSSKALH